MAEDEIMTVDEVAGYLKMNRQTITRMAARGELPAMKVGREWRFRKNYLDAMLDEELKRKLCAQ